MVERRARKARQADRGAAPVAAHHVRSRNDPQDRLLPRHRKLFAAFFRTPARASPAHAARLSAARRADVHRRKPPDRPAACAACIMATARARKSLVKYGFRLPSALDNRPLTFEEFENRVHQVVYVSATPGPYELTKTAGAVVEQIIRPTGLVDPEVEVRPIRGQVDDLLHEIRLRAEQDRARAGDHADQAHGRGSGRALHRSRREVRLSAFGSFHARSHQDSARPAPRRLTTF